MTRQTVTFATAFAFARGVAATYVDASGVTQTAAVDVPRLDHAATGGHALLGLLVQGRPEIARPDVLTIALDDSALLPASPPDRYTVLHLWMQPDGTLRRDAHFTDDPRGAFEACVGKKGWHQEPDFFGYPVDWPDDEALVQADQLTFSEDGSAVLYEGETWPIASAALATETGAQLVTETGAEIITEDQA